MKRFLYLCSFVFAFAITGNAAPGDTTWVQANQVQLDFFNDFDTTVTFPDGSVTYRKILMYFTLGKYDCPPGSTYCHQWDYTVQNYLMTATGDTVELGRFITPYATSGWPRFSGDWTQPYVFDVTDFYPLLKNDATVRIHYSGYSGGFTADIKFAFIEGTPDRNVTGISEVYDRSSTYGDPADPINDHFPIISETAPAGTEDATLKVLITGHGSDYPSGCCEFAANTYSVNLNGSSIAQQLVWRDDCGLNDLYPQGGTWIFDRANWCPGLRVEPIYHSLPGITAGSQYDLNMSFGAYTADSNFGSYTTNALLFYYGAINKNLDASLEDIIAPTIHPDYFRSNPSGTHPRIRVHNSGATPLTAITFEYGVADSGTHTFIWNGSLAPLADTLIDLPALPEIQSLSQAGLTDTFSFAVAITEANGQADEDTTNNHLSSSFVVAPTWPDQLIIDFKTSNVILDNGSFYLGNPNQKWTITDLDGNVVASRNNTDASTQYTDEVTLEVGEFYKLTITSDNHMGMHWWPLDGAGGVVQGHFKLKNINGDLIPMKNYDYSGQRRDDWGAEYSQYFTVVEGPVGISERQDDLQLNVFPNPAHEYVIVEVTGKKSEPLQVQLFNVLGQSVYQTTTTESRLRINTQTLSSGIYMLQLTSGEARQSSKLTVQH